MQGTVAYINEKNWNGKTLYSFKLANDEALYMCGTSKPPMNKGDFISFDPKMNPRGQATVDVNHIEVRKAETVTPKAFSGAWKQDDKRQRTIEWQAARNSAIAAAQVVVQAGALKLPAKEAGKYEVVMALISDLTVRFFDETQALEIKDGKAPEKEAEAASTPEEDDFD